MGRLSRYLVVPALPLFVLVAACGDDPTVVLGGDASVQDSGRPDTSSPVIDSAAPDSQVDASRDTGAPPVDGGRDTGIPPNDSGPDANLDASNVDAGSDAAVEAGADGSARDGGGDAASAVLNAEFIINLINTQTTDTATPVDLDSLSGQTIEEDQAAFAPLFP